MDLEVHKAVLDAGEAETGCTVHIVTAEVDGGPIVVQRKVTVESGDTPESLKAARPLTPYPLTQNYYLRNITLKYLFSENYESHA